MNTTNQLKNHLQLLDNEIIKNPIAKWGRMNAQNMVEHLSFSFIASTGKFGKNITGDPEKAAKWKKIFFTNEFPFPKGVRMPGTKEGQAPPPLRYKTIEEAKENLKNTVQKYFDHFKANPDDKVSHPYFGLLTFEEWTHFHEKHLQHHLTQFGIIPDYWTKNMDDLLVQIEERLQIVYKDLTNNKQAKWGMMNAQQCVEHLSWVFPYCTGKFGIPFQGDAEAAKQMWKPFQTKAMPWKTVFPPTQFTKEPPKLRSATIEEAKEVLKKSFKKYIPYCKANPTAITPHGFLGNITTEQWLYVHVKHLEHHLAQFGVIPEST